MLLRSIRSTAFVFALAGSALPLAACSGAAGTSEPSTTASSTTTTAPLSVTTHGAAKHVADALALVPLRADQRTTIEQMAQDSETRMAPVTKARQDLMMAIADQVQSGTIDRTALQPKIDAMATAHQTAEPGNRAAFEKLHDLLTPDQRVAFVTALQNGHHQAQGGQAKGEGMRGRLAKWATDLNLSQDQQDKIHDQIRARFQSHFAGAVTGTDEQKTGAIQDGHMMWQGHAMHAQWEKTLEAFKTDKFSMTELAPPSDAKPMAHEFAGHMLGMMESALPILTPDQRVAAAAKIRTQATKMDEEENAETAAPAAQ